MRGIKVMVLLMAVLALAASACGSGSNSLVPGKGGDSSEAPGGDKGGAVAPYDSYKVKDAKGCTVVDGTVIMAKMQAREQSPNVEQEAGYGKYPDGIACSFQLEAAKELRRKPHGLKDRPSYRLEVAVIPSEDVDTARKNFPGRVDDSFKYYKRTGDKVIPPKSITGPWEESKLLEVEISGSLYIHAWARKDNLTVTTFFLIPAGSDRYYGKVPFDRTRAPEVMAAQMKQVFAAADKQFKVS